MLSKPMFAENMSILFEIYDRQPTKALMEGYYLVLKDMNDDDFKASIRNILSSRKYATLPKPAEILEYAQPDLEPIAQLAFNDVKYQIMKVGKYSSITFEDKVVNSVVDALGGWIYVCSLDVSEMRWLNKEFIKLYALYAKRDSYPMHLVGLEERTNGTTRRIEFAKAGYQVQKATHVPALCQKEESVLALVENLAKEKRG